MNTKGHHSIAEEIGDKILGDALKKAGAKGKIRVGAFYLGNWLTDVSQVYDPVAFATLRNKARYYSGKLVGSIRRATRDVLKELKPPLSSVAQTASDVHVFICWLQGKTYKEAYKTSESTYRSIYSAAKKIQAEIELRLTQFENELTAYIEIFKIKQKDVKAATASLFRVKAYFKFVHPAESISRRSDPASGKTIDFTSFLKVFDKHFDQYYPYHHLDRPEILATATTGKHPGAPARSKFRSEGDATYGLFKYLSEDIRAAAGLFSEIDYNWASKVFRLRANPRLLDDGTDDFNLQLAKLGHAMHIVEDFFAHSNFVEHAALCIHGDEDDDPEKSDSLALPRSVALKYQKDVIWKRMLQDTDRLSHKAAEVKRKLPGGKKIRMGIGVEKNVVTGYFDFQDTIISLSHVAEEFLSTKDFLPFYISDIAAAEHDYALSDIPPHFANNFKDLVDDVTNREDGINAYITQLLEFIDEPADAIGNDKNVVAKRYKELMDLAEDSSKAMSKHDNEIAQKLLESWKKHKGRKVDPKVSRILAGDMWSKLGIKGHTEIRDSFIEGIELMSQAVTIGKTTITIYKAYKMIATIVAAAMGGGMIALLRKVLGNWIFDRIKTEFIKKIAAKLKRKLYRFMGSERCGCHSLIAKDNGKEPLTFYAGACARAVHWDIMKVMTRQVWPQNYMVARSPFAGTAARTSKRGRKHVNTAAQQKWIDWEELLFFYLRNPVNLDGVMKPFASTSITHKPRPDDTLLKLVEFYKPNAVIPSEFTWRRIRDANSALGRLGPNQKLMFVEEIVIPDQLLMLPGCAMADKDHAWWRPILEKSHRDGTQERGWRTLRDRDGWTDTKGYGKRTIPVSYHVRNYIKEDQLKAFIRKQASVREQMRKAYWIPG